MQRWRPAPSAGNLVGILALLVCVGGIAALWFGAIPGAADSSALLVALWALLGLLAIVAVGIAILLWGYATLGYRLDESAGGALVIRWAWRSIRIPLAEIEYLGPARQLLGITAARHLFPWPGYYLNTLGDDALGRIRLFATLPPRRQLLVCSARGSFGISPDAPAALVARFTALNDALERGGPLPTALLAAPPIAELEDEEDLAHPGLAGVAWSPARERAAAPPRSPFADRPTVVLALLGGALLAAMLWFILLRFDAIPQTLPLHYNATGQPDRIGTPREIFLFPLIAALVAVANLALAWSVIRFDRFAARLLLGGTCLVQTVAWVALLKLF